MGIYLIQNKIKALKKDKHSKVILKIDKKTHKNIKNVVYKIPFLCYYDIV